jgi:hypothetical protein
VLGVAKMTDAIYDGGAELIIKLVRRAAVHTRSRRARRR